MGDTMDRILTDQIETEVDQALSRGFRVCFASVDIELQASETQLAYETHKRLEGYRDQAALDLDEPTANAALIGLSAVGALIHEMQMWQLLKADRIEEAWDQLVDAQSNLRFVLRHRDQRCLIEWSARLLAAEEMLFPPQVFVSSGHTFESADCTICGKVYGDCEHLATRIYMGRVCQMRIYGLVPDHVAIVDDPRDKACRITRTRHGDFMFCTLTHRQMEAASDNESNVVMTSLRVG
jgi:hypothetical protein